MGNSLCTGGYSSNKTIEYGTVLCQYPNKGIIDTNFLYVVGSRKGNSGGCASESLLSYQYPRQTSVSGVEIS